MLLLLLWYFSSILLTATMLVTEYSDGVVIDSDDVITLQCRIPHSSFNDLGLNNLTLEQIIGSLIDSSHTFIVCITLGINTIDLSILIL